MAKVKLEKNHNDTWELFNDETDLWLATIEQREDDLWYEVEGIYGFKDLDKMVTFLSPSSKEEKIIKDTMFIYTNTEDNRCLMLGPVRFMPLNAASFVNQVVRKGMNSSIHPSYKDIDIDSAAEELMMHGSGFQLEGDDGGHFYIVNLKVYVSGVIMAESVNDPADVM